MTIEARVIADSVYDGGSRLTTFVLKYPRFVHAEFMTHRVFSRNAASSRAIPIKTMMRRVIDEPAVPIHWGRNQKGMQAAGELTGWRKWLCRQLWLKARWFALAFVQVLVWLDLHKQIGNRLLEPWMHIEVVVTGTRFANFYALRDHPMAEPHMQELARKMIEAHSASTPKVLRPGEWHLPFVNESLHEDFVEYAEEVPGGSGMIGIQWPEQMVSAARCARVSYLKHDSTKATIGEEFALYDRLVGGTPMHASPTEHQARVPISPADLTDHQSNLRGWVQFRKLHEKENINSYRGFYG
jgi:hypothetical protein